MTGLEMLSCVRNIQTSSGVHNKSLCPDEYSVFLGCQRVSWLLEYWGRVAYPTLDPPLSEDSAGFCQDSKGRSALYLTPGVLFGIDGIQYLKCSCKPQEQRTESPSSCRNCQCVKRQQPCSIFCCCKGRCNNSVATNYMDGQSLFKASEQVVDAMDEENSEQHNEDVDGISPSGAEEEEEENEGREEDDISLAQSGSDDDDNFGGDQDDDEL